MGRPLWGRNFLKLGEGANNTVRPLNFHVDSELFCYLSTGLGTSGEQRRGGEDREPAGGG